MAYQTVVDRLQRKYETAKTLVPAPEVLDNPEANKGVIAFGSSSLPMREALDTLASKGLPLNYLRLRALPLSAEVEAFIEKNSTIYVVEQNRDGQLTSILRANYPRWANKFHSVLHYDGLPMTAQNIVDPLLNEKG